MNRNRLLTLALLLSVAVNLLLLGGITFRLATMEDLRRLGPPSPSVAWVVRDLSEERRQQLEPMLQAHSEEIRPLRRDLMSAQRRVSELMNSAQFDREDWQQGFARLREAADSYQSVSHAQTISILAQLTPDERRIAQQFLQRRGPADGRRPSDGRRPPPPRQD